MGLLDNQYNRQMLGAGLLDMAMMAQGGRPSAVAAARENHRRQQEFQEMQRYRQWQMQQAQVQMAQEQAAREKEQSLFKTLPEDMRPFAETGRMDLYNALNPQVERTNAAKMLIEAGFQPGTPEFQAKMTEYMLKPQMVMQSPPFKPEPGMRVSQTDPNAMEIVPGGTIDRKRKAELGQIDLINKSLDNYESIFRKSGVGPNRTYTWT